MSRADWKRPEIKSCIPGYERIKLVISYDGSKFHGWQEQDNSSSVQAELSRVLSEINGEKIDVIGSGRTDAGVHALAQVAHFDTNAKIPAEKYALILNTRLDKSIRIISSEKAEDDFHSRFSTMAREYWYMIKRMDRMLAFDDGYYGAYKTLPDVDMLNSYASVIFGTHDFTTFASARDLSESKYRDVYVSEWDVINDRFSSDVLRYRVCGNAFLYHQVRSMVGTMMEAANLGFSREKFKSILEERDRSLSLRTAPAAGLYLARISYSPDEYQWFEDEYAR